MHEFREMLVWSNGMIADGELSCHDSLRFS